MFVKGMNKERSEFQSTFDYGTSRLPFPGLPTEKVVYIQSFVLSMEAHPTADGYVS